MRANGLVVWLLIGAGVVLLYASVTGSTVASVLAGHPVKAARGASSGPSAPSVTPGSFGKPFTVKNPFGTIIPKGTANPFPHLTPLGAGLP